MPTGQVQLDLARFTRGLHAALPRARVLGDYSGDIEDRTPCERIANSHIHRGADVVFAVAGRCGTGALAVARTRGVWAVGSEESTAETSYADLLTRPYKEHNWGISRAVERYLRGTLPRGPRRSGSTRGATSTPDTDTGDACRPRGSATPRVHLAFRLGCASDHRAVGEAGHAPGWWSP